MRRIILCLFVIGFSHHVSSENNYYSYCEQMKDKLNAIFSVPQNKMDFHSNLEIPFLAISFGEMLESFPAVPTFEGGPAVKLSKHCLVIMMNLDFMEKNKNPESLYDKDYFIPTPSCWMLSNCGLPWAPWYIEGRGGVIQNDAGNNVQRMSEEERGLLKEKVNQMRSLYERRFKDSKLTKKMNCVQMAVVRIPHMEMITNMINPEYMDRIKNSYTECYGVELYNKKNRDTVRMLFFIYGGKTDINKCLTKISNYIKFED